TASLRRRAAGCRAVRINRGRGGQPSQDCICRYATAVSPCLRALPGCFHRLEADAVATSAQPMTQPGTAAAIADGAAAEPHAPGHTRLGGAGGAGAQASEENERPGAGSETASGISPGQPGQR